MCHFNITGGAIPKWRRDKPGDDHPFPSYRDLASFWFSKQSSVRCPETRERNEDAKRNGFKDAQV